MTVRFSVAEEFLDEIEKDAGEIERGIVRVTNTYTPSRISASIHHLAVVATYTVAGVVVRFEHYCGDVCGAKDFDAKVIDLATETQRRIEEKARDLGLQIRAGVIEEPTGVAR